MRAIDAIGSLTLACAHRGPGNPERLARVLVPQVVMAVVVMVVVVVDGDGGGGGGW